MAGSPVYITANNGSPVNITGAGAGSIPISGIAAPIGSVADQPIAVGPTGNLVAAPGFYESVLFHTAIPFIFASSGTIGNNGALSAITALPTTYANAYILVPAGAIATGIPAAAAWYYVTMSSTTAGTIFNNTYTSGQPTIPASPTAFVTTGPGAFTGVSAATFGPQYSMPGNTMGTRGILRLYGKFATTNTSANKICDIVFGGSNASTATITTSATFTQACLVSNREVTGAQVAGINSTTGGTGISGASYDYLAIDTTSTVAVGGRGTNSTPATNNIVIESFTVELLKGS